MTTVCEQKHPVKVNSKYVKKIRIYFTLCSLQYCTNPITPFHVLISDAVEVCGGPHQPLQILGCTSSPDTHDQFAC